MRPLYDDLVPLIVPPTGTKSTYYGNLSLRAQWRRAVEDLRKARRLIIIGYSFPRNDLQTRHFIAGAVKQKQVTIVDYRAEVIDEVKMFLPEAVFARSFSGPSAVDDYVNDHCGDIVRWSVDSTASMAGGWVTALSVNGTDVLDSSSTVHTRPWNNGDSSQAVQWLEDQVEQRWPGIQREATHYRPPSATESMALAQMAYVPRGSSRG